MAAMWVRAAGRRGGVQCGQGQWRGRADAAAAAAKPTGAGPGFGPWPAHAQASLREAVVRGGAKQPDWTAIAQAVGQGHTPAACAHQVRGLLDRDLPLSAHRLQLTCAPRRWERPQWRHFADPAIKRDAWTQAEDRALLTAAMRYTQWKLTLSPTVRARPPRG
jgi:hypothetical protein